MKGVNMKKLILLLIVTAIIIIACNKKAVPVITERRTQPTKSFTSDPSLSIVIPDTSIGKTVFINRCGKCHGLPEPNQFTSKRWNGILSYMIPRARLTDEQGIHVTAYLKATAAL